MLSGWQWALLGVVPPAIVALYFLKLKRQPIEVPSTYLWHKSIEDLHVNSIWQKLKKSLLLFLQLVLMTLLILALLRPSWSGAKLSGARSIFLIDNSASMGATDGDSTRLAQAKELALARIDDMRSGDVAMIVAFSDTAQVAQSFTDNRGELRRRLAEIELTDRRTSLDEALRVASGLAQPARSTVLEDGQDIQISDIVRPARLFILSDGRFPDVQDFNFGYLDPVYVPIGDEAAANVGIMSFGTRRNEERPDRLEAFAQIENFGDQETIAKVSLFLDGQLNNVKEVNLPKAGGSGVAFDLGDASEGACELRIEVPTEVDRLAIDNVAWAPINRPRRGKVAVVSPGNEALDLSLTTGAVSDLVEVQFHEPAWLTSDEYHALALAGGFDLVVFDRCRPEKPEDMPRSNTWFIGAAPPLEDWSLGELAPAPSIIDTDRSHPLMQLIDLGNVIIQEGSPVKGPRGAKTLIESELGALFTIAPREGLEDAVLGFELDDSPTYVTNWPTRLSFPVFILNVVGYLAGGGERREFEAVRPGDPVTWRTAEGIDRITVLAPDGESSELKRDSAGECLFGGTQRVGMYEVQEGQPTGPGRFAVNLFDAEESSIRPRATFSVGETSLAGESDWEVARKSLWKPLVLLGLAVLLIEWYIYNRRVHV